MKTKEVYVAWTNTDLTEGRGYRIPLAVCECEATAIRLGKKGYVQGCDCPITKEVLIEHEDKWYGPVFVVSSTKEDDIVQKNIDSRNAAIKKAKEFGLNDDDISALSK